MSNLVSFESSSKKLKFEISRSSVTLTFNPRTLKLFKVKDFVINYVCAKSSKKLKFEILRSSVTLTFDPRTLELFKVEDFLINYVYVKFSEIWTIQSKVIKCFIFGAKTPFSKIVISE